MLETIKLLLDIKDASKDNLLNYLLTAARQRVRTYCKIEELPQELEDCVIDLAIIRYNQLGSEGLQSESYSGVSQSFVNDIPQTIKSQLNKYRRLKTL